MKFDTILEYQKIDSEIVKIERDVASSEKYRAVSSLSKQFEAAKSDMHSINDEVTAALNVFDKAKTAFEELREQIDDLASVDVTVVDAFSTIEYYERQINSLYERYTALEKECIRIQNLVGDLIKRRMATMARGRELGEQKKDAYEAFYKFREPYMEKSDRLKAQMKALESKIALDAPELLEKYKNLRASNKMPALVEYEARDERCPRCCGMEISFATADKLKVSGSYIECPNCHKILYVKG